MPSIVDAELEELSSRLGREGVRYLIAARWEGDFEQMMQEVIPAVAEDFEGHGYRHDRFDKAMSIFKRAAAEEWKRIKLYQACGEGYA